MYTEGSMQQIYMEVKLFSRIMDCKFILHGLLPSINHFSHIYKASNNEF